MHGIAVYGSQNRIPSYTCRGPSCTVRTITIRANKHIFTRPLNNRRSISQFFKWIVFISLQKIMNIIFFFCLKGTKYLADIICTTIQTYFHDSYSIVTHLIFNSHFIWRAEWWLSMSSKCQFIWLRNTSNFSISTHFFFFYRYSFHFNLKKVKLVHIKLKINKLANKDILVWE